MATIFNNPAYGEGHKVILKGKLSDKAAKVFSANGYKPDVAVFALTKKGKPTKIIDIGSGTDSILLKDASNKVIQVVGSVSALNNLFNHYSEGKSGGKEDTRLLTELKENISMIIFQSYFEKKKILTEDQVIAAIGTAKKKHFNTLYYESAIKQLNALKPLIKQGGYQYERQATNLTVKLYKTATKLTNKQNDNWNPADVWMIKNGFDIDKLASMTDIDDINEAIAKAYKSRHLIPISLKQVTTEKAAADVIDPADMMTKKLDIDFGFAKVDLSDSFNNFIVTTNSGFQARVGYKASVTTLRVSIEGRMAGAGYQLGGVDAKWYPKYITTKYGYDLRSGSAVAETDYETAKKELKQMFVKYDRLSVTIANYEQAIKLFEAGDKLTKDRFANLISYMYSFLMVPGPKFKEHMQAVYYTAKKVAADNSLYLLLANE